MKKLILKLILAFGGFWKRIGANPNHLKAILETKILMDGRRASSFNVQKKGKDLNHSDLALSFIYLVFGSLAAAALYFFEGQFSGYVGFYTFWIVLLLITLITDFTDVLIDVRDNYILLPTPISGKTLALSRTLHLVLYLSNLIIPFILPGLIYCIIVKGVLFALLFFIQFILAMLFSIFLVNIIYLLLLNLTSGQKFKDIINYFQIGFSIFIFSCYYVLPRLIDTSTIKDFNIEEKWWMWCMPGSYFAGLLNVIFEGDHSYKIITLSILGHVFTFGGIYLVANVLSRNFNQKLLSINIKGDTKKADLKIETEDSNTYGYMNFWDKLINKNRVESSGFRMSWMMTARNRMYKLRTYPMFGMIPAFFIYFALDRDGNLSERYQSMQDGSSDITLLYFALFAIITPLINTKFAESHKAASIFKALPIKKPGLLIRGNCNAILIKFGLPTFLTCAIAVLLMYGLDRYLNIAIALGNAILILYLMTLFAMKNIPFSNAWEDQSKGTNTSIMFIVMTILGVVGFAHYMFRENKIVLISFLAVSLIFSYFIYNKIGNLKWSELSKE